MAPDGLDERRQGHFVGAAKREVANAGFGTTISVAREKIELMNPLVAVRSCFYAI
jgi:hypothetical protein